MKKLAKVRADLKSGEIDKLTMKIGKDKYGMRQDMTKRMQIFLEKEGLLEKKGDKRIVYKSTVAKAA